MNDQNKTKNELILELQGLRQEFEALKTTSSKNIIERNRSEASQRFGEEMLLKAQRLAHFGSWEWDQAADRVSWSEELFHIAGLDSKLPAPPYAEQHNHYTSDSWNILQAAVENALKTGESYRLELEMTRPDGTIRNVIAYGGIRYNGHQEKIIGLYGLVQDITEQKQTERALRESELNFEKVIISMTETLSIITGEGDFIFANTRAAYNLSGGKPEDVIGKNIRDFVPLAQANKLIESYKKVISTKQPVIEEMNITLSGSDKWFLSTFRYFQCDSKKVSAVLSISLDITERRQTENALRKSEERNRMLSSVTMEGILIHRNGIAIDLNLSLVNMLGYEYKELVNKDFFEIVHVDDHAMVRENIVKEYAYPYEARAISSTLVN